MNILHNNTMMYVYGRGLASSGRFEVEMGIRLPNLTEKEEILKRKLATMKTDPELDFPKLSKFVGGVYVLLMNMETILQADRMMFIYFLSTKFVPFFCLTLIAFGAGFPAPILDGLHTFL